MRLTIVNALKPKQPLATEYIIGSSVHRGVRSAPNMDIIAEFMSRYRREFDFYDQVARLVAQRLEALVQAVGIRAIVTARAKSPSRLDSKVRQRNRRTQYASVEEVSKDIVDLAGARLALYFPADRVEVEKLIRGNFDLLEPPKVFPQASSPTYEKRFSGYWATHYRVRLLESSLSDSQKRYSEARIEIQVASVLMHAWSEVEHDLVYKPADVGSLSSEEYAILDELNGLVITGEIALERLQKAMEARIAEKDRRFDNHFDLAAYLFEAARPMLQAVPDESALGRIDLLYALLEKLELDTPGKVAPFISNLHSDTERRPIAEQIIDQIIGADPDRYALYSELRSVREFEEGGALPQIQSPDLQQAMGRFLDSWIRFEKAIRSRFTGELRRPTYPITRLIRESGTLEDPAIRFDVDRIRTVRNNLVHGIEMPDKDTLLTAAQRLDQITSVIKRRKKG